METSRSEITIRLEVVRPQACRFNLIMGLTGLTLPFLIHIWNGGYIWVSIVLMLFVFIHMAVFNETRYKQLRRLVGLPYIKGNKQLPAEPPSSSEDVAAPLGKD